MQEIDVERDQQRGSSAIGYSHHLLPLTFRFRDGSIALKLWLRDDVDLYNAGRTGGDKSRSWLVIVRTSRRLTAL